MDICSLFFYVLYVRLNVLLGLTLLIQNVYTILCHDHEFLRYVLLHFQGQFPFSILLSSKTLTDFFTLCHCKHIDNKLCRDVANASGMKKNTFHIFSPPCILHAFSWSYNSFVIKFFREFMPLNMRGIAMSRFSLLCLSLLKFINSFMHYLKFKVSISYPLPNVVFHTLSRCFHIANAL